MAVSDSLAMLRILDVHKAYDNTFVLDIPFLELGEGIYWLKGPNGSGKTTLLQLIAGLAPFDGDITWDGISQRNSPRKYRGNVSWAGAEPAYPSFVTGRELLAFYCRIRKSPPEEADELATSFGIRSYLAWPVGQYSDGMVKRLSLVLAFIGKAPLIVLDEPLATLDAEIADLLPGLIGKYRHDFGVSFIFSSHLSLASGELPLAVRVEVNGGRVRQPCEKYE
ncbi:MAG TPA: ABC transporter ATP-binding protein [Puia sp.]|nr:ABC transporter ATP-binding protein [Puia sp.]